MKFSSNVAHEIRNNLEQFWDVAINSLNAESILLFSGFVIVGNIMKKKRAN